MKWALVRYCLIVVGISGCAAVAAAELAFETVSFNGEIRGILAQHCFACHGPGEEDRKADFRIDTAAGATADLGGYSAIEPGDPDSSEAFRRITSDDESERMPPTDHGPALSATEVQRIRRWIEQGAEYETHWAFVPPTKPNLPPSTGGTWARSPIDRFVAKRLETLGLKPSPPAAPERLIRRLALDLTGLPPTTEMVARFVADPTETTYEKIVDQLLASPSYGEHWASMWLDLARYADTYGYAEDMGRIIWPWRDWVIMAFNQNMPYDQFTIEQLAGDLLPQPTESQILATAFHRNTLSNTEGGTNDEEFRTIAVKDRLGTTLNVWMGLTMRCAECHSHKYDPISQKEYYQFLDFFNQTADADRVDDHPVMELRSPDQDVELGEVDPKIAEILQRQGAPVEVPILEQLPRSQLRATHVMLRGNYRQLGELVSAGVMEAFHPLPEGAPNDRLGVAKWLMSPENPLTARAAVNRFWARLFGTGIVETEEDFGSQGMLPTHPKLLDWLAVDFRDGGWDIKRLLRTIVLSATYQQTSVTTPEQLERDSRNRYLSRGPRIRLSAEEVRDQALAVSGLLSDKRYGPPVYPPNPIKKVVSAFTDGMEWKVSEGEDRYRRAIYTYLKRSQPHPLFETFDMATREVCSLRRFRTNTPLQSFMTLNDPVFVEAAQALARKMHDSSPAIEQRIVFGIEQALFQRATPFQISTLADLYHETYAQYQTDPDSASLMAGQESTKDVAPESARELAALTVLANVILNLDEFLTK